MIVIMRNALGMQHDVWNRKQGLYYKPVVCDVTNASGY